MIYEARSLSEDCVKAISGTLQRLDYLPTVVAVYGSVARGCSTPQSDIDLLVVRGEAGRKLARAQMVFEEKRLQIVVGPVEAFQVRMENARRERENFVSHALANSLFVGGDIAIFDELFTMAVNVEKRGPPPPTDRELAGYAMRVHDTLLKLDKDWCGGDIAIVSHLLRTISFFIFRKHGRWIAPGIYGKVILLELEPVFYKSLLYHMKSAVATGAVGLLVGHVQLFLSSSGFPTWESPSDAPF